MKGIRIIGNYRKVPDGYGTMCIEYIRALLSIGFTDFKITQAFQGNWKEDEFLSKLENKQIDYDVNLIMLTADNVRVFKEEGKKNIVFTMWETTDLPSHWPDLCNQCDAVVVPSTFCKEVFRKSGVEVPIHILPIPTDVNKFNVVRVNKELEEMTKGKFVFYSIFQWGERKNPKALLNAYYSSFSAKDDVLMIIKSHLTGNNDGFEIEKRVKEVRINIKRNSMDYPKVFVISDNLTENQIGQIHKIGDVCLSSTRGEGWNLPLMDAALAGNHIIATNFSSHTDFIDTYNHFKFQIYDRVGYQLEHCHNAGSLYTSNQKWANVNVQEFSMRMKRAYDEWKTKGVLYSQNHRDEYSKYLKTLYSYDNIGKKLLAIIQEIK